MGKHVDIALSPEVAFDDQKLLDYLVKAFGISKEKKYRILRRSIDARHKQIKVNLSIELEPDLLTSLPISYIKKIGYVVNAPPVLIIGAGPAGLFAALKLIELGYKPIIIERGKDVRARRRDLAAIHKSHIVNPDSNYCFGEGGAGTYSDGKLYTRSKKRGDVRRILEILVAHGASESILIDAHPHVGTNKLPAIITSIRQTILDSGGEIHFNTRMVDIELVNQQVKSITTQHGDKIQGMGLILATGHSARDIFYLLYEKNILIESKPYAIGVRIEHPQSVIDQIQYHGCPRGDYLPASSYSLVTQVNYKGQQRGVFSFCMCPGGFIVPSATAPGEIVVNGMSPSRRDSFFANSGIVVEVTHQDFKPYQAYGPLASLKLQESIEQQACQLAGGTQKAPAQRLVDFLNRKQTSDLLRTSYQPGLMSVPMDDVFPDFIAKPLREAFISFGKKMPGYITPHAQLVGVESRTSSPIFIPRDSLSLEHVQIKRLYPCGEGAGYAGGIVSAAMDGERCAVQLALNYKK